MHEKRRTYPRAGQNWGKFEIASVLVVCLFEQERDTVDLFFHDDAFISFLTQKGIYCVVETLKC